MALGFATALRSARATAIVTAVGSTGKLRIYSGSRPATGGSATTLLAELALPNPVGTVSNGVLTFGSITDDAEADNSGTATWWRIVDGSNNPIIDGDAGATGSGKELELDSVSIVQGGTVEVSSFVITEGNA